MDGEEGSREEEGKKMAKMSRKVLRNWNNYYKMYIRSPVPVPIEIVGIWI